MERSDCAGNWMDSDRTLASAILFLHPLYLDSSWIQPICIAYDLFLAPALM